MPRDRRDPARMVYRDMVQLPAGPGAGPSVLGVGVFPDHDPVKGGRGDDEQREQNDSSLHVVK